MIETAVAVECVGLSKSYIDGDGQELHILNEINFSVEAGRLAAVMGQSGSGKSTLLHLLGGLDRPTSGEVRLGGVNLNHCSDAELARLRNRDVGFVFQFHHLLKEFSALENVMLPLKIGGVDHSEAEKKARYLLDRVGLSHRLSHRPNELSGGEQQRTAVARALATSPSIVLADEPSGNLDYTNGHLLHTMLVEVVRELGVAMVVVTHNPELAERADVVYELVRGNLTVE